MAMNGPRWGTPLTDREKWSERRMKNVKRLKISNDFNVVVCFTANGTCIEIIEDFPPLDPPSETLPVFPPFPPFVPPFLR
jgi:hypothetical protein